MKVFLSSSFLLNLIHSEKRETLKQLLFESLDTNTRFFTSVHSIHVLFQELGQIPLEKKTMILRNLEDLTDSIFSLEMDAIRSELLFEEGFGLEQVIALTQGMDEFYLLTENKLSIHPLLKVRNFFGETK